MATNINELQGLNGFGEYAAGSSGTKDQTPNNVGYRCLVVAEDAVISAIAGTSIDVGSGFMSRVHPVGFVIYGPIDSFTVASGVVYGYYR